MVNAFDEIASKGENREAIKEVDYRRYPVCSRRTVKRACERKRSAESSSSR
jgi:hypothetical protein